MKKIYISADIEGIWGNSNPANTIKKGVDYSEYATNMTKEVNLLIEELFNQGVEEVLVNDSHGNMDNILASQLDPRAGIVVGNGAYKEYGMMEGLDSTFDGACFVGYHCRSNTSGIMSHTISGGMVEKITLDGKVFGESGLNAKLAEEYGVPVLLVSGDHLLKEQLKDELKDTYIYVETKKVISSQCGICCSWNELKRRYHQAVKTIFERKQEKEQGQKQAHVMQITFHHIRNADFVARMDGVNKVDNCTVEIQKDNYADLYKYMRFVIKVCNAFV